MLDTPKSKTSSFSQMKQLPLCGLYHMRNYSSDGNWLGYQVSLTQVRLIKYNENIAIRESFAFQFPPEPIKQIKVIVDEKDDSAYMAVLFLTKYVIYKNNTEVCSYRLKLDKNIVVFQNSFVSCDGFNDSKSIFFTFLTANGEVHSVSVQNPGNKVLSSFQTDSRFCTIKSLGQNAVLGTENGKIFLISIIYQSLLNQFDTKSNMPILHLKSLNQRIIAATCQGEIFNFSEDLKSFTSLSVHQGMIAHLETTDQRIYTFGDDGFLNVFQIDNKLKDLKLKKSSKYSKKVNMIVSLHSQTFLNFYEDTAFEQIVQP